LLEANLSVITAAKISFKKPTNEQCTKKFEEAKNEVITAMRELLFEVSKGSSRMGRTLSRSLSQKRVSSILRSNINRQSANSNPGIVVHSDAAAPGTSKENVAATAGTPNDKPVTSPSKENVTAAVKPAEKPAAAAAPVKEGMNKTTSAGGLAVSDSTSPRSPSPTPDRAPRQLGRQAGGNMAINRPRTNSSENIEVSGEGKKASPTKDGTLEC